MKVLCLLPVLGQPRHAKRIAMLQSIGCEVEVLAFDRDYHSGRMPGAPVRILGQLESGRYANRIWRIARALPVIRGAMRRADVVYAFGTDMAYTACVAGAGLGKPVTMEIGDIRELQCGTGLKSKLFRKIDRFFANRYRMIVLTSPLYREYYQRWLGSGTDTLVIENKLERADTAAMQAAGASAPGNDRPPAAPVRIGYFGLLRCAWSWSALEALARSHPDTVQIVAAGHVLEPDDLAARAAALDNVRFLGPYESPAGLHALYGEVDIVWACYPSPEPGEWNWRWARTNRFYESCYFGKPMIALAGSGDAQAVEELGLGMLVDGGMESEALARTLPEHIKDNIARWKSNMDNIPDDVYILDSEYEMLKVKLSEIARRKS